MIARTPGRPTVRPMPHAHTYLDLVRQAAASGPQTAPGLLFFLFTPRPYWQLLGADVVGDQLRVAPAAPGEPGVLPLARAARAVLAEHRNGSVAELLWVPDRYRAGALPTLCRAVEQFETPEPIVLAGLWPASLAALVERAPDAAHRQAVLSYGGLPARSQRAATLRRGLSARHLRWVAGTLDEMAAEAGFTVSLRTRSDLA